MSSISIGGKPEMSKHGRLRALALSLMLFSAFSQPVVSLAESGPRTCREIFVNEEREALDSVMKQLLQRQGVDTQQRSYKKFLRNISQKEKIGRLEVAWLAEHIANEQLKAELWEKQKGLGYVVKLYSPSSFLDQYIREQVINHGFLDTLERLGLLRDSTATDNFRGFLRKYDIGYLTSSLILTIPVAVVHGPLSFSVGITLAGTPLPLLHSKPVPKELLVEAIEKGIPSVRPQLEKIYGNRARVEAVQHVIELAVWALFFASVYTFTEDYYPWIRFAGISMYSWLNGEEIARAQNALGIEQRVEIQVDSWSNAYREFMGHDPSQVEQERKRREFRKFLSHL